MGIQLARPSGCCSTPSVPYFHITDIVAFQREPEFYAYGMLCSLTVAAIWQILSSYLSFNTSSTHSISE